jgi:NADH-quinone oxidoreductase subunit N
VAGPQLSTLLWIVAAVTMTLGNILALLQDNLRRLLAYSSVAHAGYMLIGLSVAPYLARGGAAGAAFTGTDAVLFYLVAYGAMTVGAFAVLGYLAASDHPAETVDDLSGLSRSRPGAALLMTLFLLSLIGIPPTPGFWGKWQLFFGAFAVPYGLQDAALREQAWLFRLLAVIGAVNAAIGAWYYLRIITVMYLRTPLRVPAARRRPAPVLAAAWACALITLVFSYPRPLLDEAQRATVNDVRVPAATAARDDAGP